MLNNLREFRAELENDKATALAADFTTEIEAAVETYRKELIATKENERNAIVAKIDSDIDCVDRLIAREMKTCAVPCTDLHTTTATVIADPLHPDCIVKTGA